VLQRWKSLWARASATIVFGSAALLSPCDQASDHASAIAVAASHVRTPTNVPETGRLVRCEDGRCRCWKISLRLTVASEEDWDDAGANGDRLPRGYSHQTAASFPFAGVVAAAAAAELRRNRGWASSGPMRMMMLLRYQSFH
jgi:hypothetical protein